MRRERRFTAGPQRPQRGQRETTPRWECTRDSRRFSRSNRGRVPDSLGRGNSGGVGMAQRTKQLDVVLQALGKSVCTSRDVSLVTGLSRASCSAHLCTLRDMGLVRVIGSDQRGHRWVAREGNRANVLASAVSAVRSHVQAAAEALASDDEAAAADALNRIVMVVDTALDDYFSTARNDERPGGAGRP